MTFFKGGGLIKKAIANCVLLHNNSCYGECVLFPATAHLNGIVPHVSIDSRLSFIKDQPDTIQVVTIAIEKSIQENLAPVIERAIKIALTTCEQIIKQVGPLTQFLYCRLFDDE